MGCRSIHRKLPQYVQGLLPVADARSIADHVRACSPCRQEMAEIEKVWASLGQLPAPEAAGTLFSGVLERIDAAAQKRTGSPWTWLSLFRPSFAGAAAAVMLIGFVSGALISAVYSADSGQEQAADDSAYSEILSDTPPASFSDLYLQSMGQNSQEKAL